MKRGFLALAVRVLCLGVAVYVVLTYGFLITQCHGQDMFPAVKDGDLCIVFRKTAQNLFGEKNATKDIVAYQAGGERHFGRIVAAEGDIVTINDSGSLMVNGVTEGGEILFPTYVAGELEYPYRVPEGTVFVMGDHRTNTTDSRTLGPVALKDIEGKLITILRRRGL